MRFCLMKSHRLITMAKSRAKHEKSRQRRARATLTAGIRASPGRSCLHILNFLVVQANILKVIIIWIDLIIIYACLFASVHLATRFCQIRDSSPTLSKTYGKVSSRDIIASSSALLLWLPDDSYDTETVDEFPLFYSAWGLRFNRVLTLKCFISFGFISSPFALRLMAGWSSCEDIMWIIFGKV